MSNQVFLSSGFDAASRPSVEVATAVLEAAGYDVVRGTDLGGAEVGDGVKALIRRCDALVALMTRDEASGGTRARAWVHDEYAIAKSLDLPKIAVIFPGIAAEGFIAADERIEFEPDNPTTAWIKLMRTARVWRGDAERRGNKRMALAGAAVLAVSILVSLGVGALLLAPDPGQRLVPGLAADLKERLFEFDECATHESGSFACRGPADELRRACERLLVGGRRK